MHSTIQSVEDIPQQEAHEEMLKVFEEDELKEEQEEDELLHLCYILNQVNLKRNP